MSVFSLTRLAPRSSLLSNIELNLGKPCPKTRILCHASWRNLRFSYAFDPLVLTGPLGKAAGKLLTLAAIDHVLLWCEKAIAAGVPVGTRIPNAIGLESLERARENLDIFDRQRLIIAGDADVLRVRGFGADGADAPGGQSSAGEQRTGRTLVLVS